ncbi:uncharacterized protein [Littorina saxatilis]|uniref:Uncharacterized protein n=1 Tax=Littorina saxatilis TaxID=31220 RepID=A0AAN9B4Y8_9CAEN
MTTKMIATRGDGVMRCCVVLLLLLLGVTSGQTQCNQKMTECSSLLSNIATELTPLATPPYNATALDTACSSARQTMTNCVREANESCSGQPEMLGNLTTLVTSLDFFCGPALICQLKATACQAALLEVLPTGPPSGTGSETTGGVDMLPQLCPLYEQASQCLQALTATDKCREVEAVKNMTSAFAMATSGCAAVTGGQACPQSSACFSAFMPAAESAGQCSAMQTYVGCLSGLKGTCTFDESKITLTDLQSLTTSVCKGKVPLPFLFNALSLVLHKAKVKPLRIQGRTK